MKNRSTISMIQKSPAECISGSQGGQFLALGKKMGWPFQVLGKAPMLAEPIRIHDWLLVPAHQDSSPIPPRAYQRIQTIFTSGLRPQGFVLVHEAPKQIGAPKVEEKKKPDTNLLGKVGVAALGFGVLSGSLVAAIGILILGGLLLMPLGLLAAAVLIDPILVVVTKDGYWIEIDRWEA